YFLICRSCGTPILVGGGTSCWGPKPGEQLQLFCFQRNSYQASGIFITVPDEIRATEDWLFPDLVKAVVSCPHCHTAGSVTDTLQEGEACPQCRHGTVQDRGSSIY